VTTICDSAEVTAVLHRVKKTDTPIMSHNSSKNRTVSMIFDISNYPSTFDTFP